MSTSASTLEPRLRAVRADSPAPVLRQHVAADPVSVPAGDRLREILCETLDRGDRVPAGHATMWRQFLHLLEQQRNDPRSTARCAVLANLVAVAAFDEPADHVATAELADQLGTPRLVRLQHRASTALETDPLLPWTSATVRNLRAADIAARLVAAGHAPQAADDIAKACAGVARALVFQDLDPDRTTDQVTSVLQFLNLVERGSIVEWRDQLGMVAASPWGPYADHLLLLARESEQPEVLAVVEAAIEECREWCRDQERDQVAREIRHLVAVSGSSQREFAARIGTSPSRLSTYVRGTVTPSAAMLLRIQRASRSLQHPSARVIHPGR
ncbi:MAG TPA: helix-turn-helix transcriptional regulator [Nocardioides sp.]|nr:helix-turn-helix transcriptional regulator [Nocardioides sp.]